ncbi:csn protein [Levilactobacillus paucivorans]|uniref:Csn protein n=1 Tax=Levilactobacillus paucivorans TaxID=616990 RepID=A0A0R2LT97_9LACO|nr:chitosanase [Levilactobacillus paucivorans]KRO04808.1 csn protein [Levilactobacillus paucivorans]
MKHQLVKIITLIGLLTLTLAGCQLPSTTSGYQPGHTIKVGQRRETTFALVASAENSTTNYHRQYGYLEDIGDGRGYTAGIIGFTTANGDLRQVIQRYVHLKPQHNGLKPYLPALKAAVGSATHHGLGHPFIQAWHQAAKDPKLIHAENYILDTEYLNPVLRAAKKDNLSPLGQYIYYDAMVVHGPGNDKSSFGGIRRQAKRLAKTPRQGGNETHYLQAFLKARTPIMRQEAAHHDLSRLNAQRQFIRDKNFQLQRPLRWQMYGDRYHLN